MKKMEIKELNDLVGKNKVNYFNQITNKIDSLYEMDKIWSNGGKKWNLEYKYRRGGKTLCAFYFKKDVLGLMIIFGRNERDKFDEIKNNLSGKIVNTYDFAKTYHDGKWVMFNIEDDYNIDDIIKVLNI